MRDRNCRPLRRDRRLGLGIAPALTVMVLLAACSPQAGHRASGSTGTGEQGGTGIPTAAWAGPSEADGYIAPGAAIGAFGDEPALTRLDPALRAAVRKAAGAAEADGVRFVITSGWRSARYQRWLLDQAVQEYGSREEAAEWVSSPEKSEHVQGRAVDVGYTDADSWLQQHGNRYGLCQVYGNEMWHFELATTPGRSCPRQWRNARDRDAAQ